MKHRWWHKIKKINVVGRFVGPYDYTEKGTFVCTKEGCEWTEDYDIYEHNNPYLDGV